MAHALQKLPSVEIGVAIGKAQAGVKLATGASASCVHLAGAIQSTIPRIWYPDEDAARVRDVEWDGPRPRLFPCGLIYPNALS